jgi:hypothetical protein
MKSGLVKRQTGLTGVMYESAAFNPVYPRHLISVPLLVCPDVQGQVRVRVCLRLEE